MNCEWHHHTSLNDWHEKFQSGQLIPKLPKSQLTQTFSKCPNLPKKILSAHIHILFVQPTPGKFQSTSQKTDMKIPTTLLRAFSLPYPIAFPTPPYKYSPPPSTSTPHPPSTSTPHPLSFSPPPNVTYPPSPIYRSWAQL